MDFSKIKFTDYSSIFEFKRAGYTYNKVYDDENYVVWSMHKNGVLNKYFEVWKKVWKNQYDGTPYLKAPSDEEFGRTGWCVCGNLEQCKQQIKERFGISIF